MICANRIIILDNIAKYTGEINRIAVKWTRNGLAMNYTIWFHFMPWILVGQYFLPELLQKKLHGPYGPRATLEGARGSNFLYFKWGF